MYLCTHMYLCISIVWLTLEVRDCEIFENHNTEVLIHHNCESYHNCHAMLTVSRIKQAIDKMMAILVNVSF